MSSKTVRTIREPLKKPRPLKAVSSSDQMKVICSDPKDSVIQKSLDEIIADLEILNNSISNCSFDEITATDISRMCAVLKKRGAELDNFHKEAVDRYFCTIRNASRKERLDSVSRVKLLEAIEQRARGWKNANLDNYFNAKITELEQKNSNSYLSGVTSPTISYPVLNQNLQAPTVPLASGEVLRSSGKFEKPTKIVGKNHFKDEIVIRNSDSGKVMGIKGRRVHMIEELSDTVISFQRVNPGVRDRLVQITGPHEEAISHAKLLVEDTIRRNASPVRSASDLANYENNKEIRDSVNSFSALDNQPYVKRQLQHSYSVGDASLKEYSLQVQIGEDLLTLTGTNPDLLQNARLVLKGYFAGHSELAKHENFNRVSSPDSNFQRFELKRQSSLKSNLENYSDWKNDLRRDSLSPLSSSDDDGLKVGKVIAITKDLQAFDTYISRPGVKSQDSPPSDTCPIQTKDRSASLPNEITSAVSVLTEIESLQNDEVFPSLLSPVDSEGPAIPPPSYKKNTYDRQFLLSCAKSPFSHTPPEDFARVHHQFREIVCESPVMFDPDKHEKSWPPDSQAHEH